MKSAARVLAGMLLAAAFAARAQDIEPRSYSNAPVGVNFLIAGYARTSGGVAFDSATQITDPKLKVDTAIFAYARALDLWGMSGKFDAIVPYSWLDGAAQYRGAPVYSAQANVIHSFDNGVWASLDVTCLAGGRTELNGVKGNDLQKNWRVGTTLALPVDARNSIKIHASSGVSARTGNNYDLTGFAWQYRWGGGL